MGLKKIIIAGAVLTLIIMLSGCSKEFKKLNLNIVFMLENYKAVIQLADDYIKLYPEEPEFYYLAGMSYLHMEEYRNAIIYLTKCIDLGKDAYYALGTAYYDIGSYQKALENFRVSSDMGYFENDIYLYLAYSCKFLGFYDEAVEYFNMSIKKDIYKDYSLYGLGICHYDFNEYEKAEEVFYEYVSLYDNEPYVYVYLGYIENHHHKNPTESRKLFIKAINSGLDEKYDAYYGLAESYLEDEDIFLLEAQDHIPEPLYYYAMVLWDLNETKKASDYLRRYHEKDLRNQNLASAYPDLLFYTGNHEEGMKVYNELLKRYPGDFMLMEYAYTLMNYQFYREARQVMKEISKADINTHRTYASCLYYDSRFLECKEYILSLDNEIQKDYTLILLLADSCYSLHEYQKALESYERAYILFPSDRILVSMSSCALLMYDNDLAYSYYEMLDEKEGSEYILDEIMFRYRSLGEQISLVFEKYYLYRKNTEMEYAVHKRMKNTIKPDRIDIYRFLSKVICPEDIHTLAFLGDELKYYFEFSSQDGFYTYQTDDLVYIYFNHFSDYTDTTFISAVENIADPEKKDLVIDLRHNGGGRMESAFNIADCLLSECEIYTYNDGKSEYTYYSNNSKALFKNIYLFVSEETASAAELLCLALYTNLDNVKIIGMNTFGKGVTQHIYYNPAEEIVIYVVNGYFTVNGINIHKTGIKPCIMVESHDIQDYFKVIK